MKQTLSILLVLVGLTSPAALFTASPNLTIPDGNPNGVSSSIAISDVGVNLTDVNVYLTVSGGYNGDFYAYLSFNGTTVVLMNRVGKTSGSAFGYTDSGLSNIKLDDAATTDIHLYGGALGGSPLTGSWQPDRRTTDPLLVTDASARGNSLAAYNDMSPNGNWTIFFADMASGGSTATLQSWSLDLEPVPEPIETALIIFGVIVGGFAVGRRWFARA